MDLNKKPKFDTGAAAKQASNPIIQIVLLVVIIALFAFFVVGPKYRAMSSRGAEADQVSAERAKIEQEKIDLAQLNSKLDSSKQDIAITDQALPLNGRISNLYALLESLVKNSSMQLAELASSDSLKTRVAAGSNKTDAKQTDRKLITTKVTMTVTGDLQQLKNLLESIETNPRLFDIDSVQVASSEEGVRFRIDLKAYAYEN
jgi:Tfp pilus assembly protein PilO